MRLLRHFTANEEQLTPFPFKRELSMESYLVENEGILSLDDDTYSEVVVLQEELTLKEGRQSKDTDGRIDLLISYSNNEVIGVVELKLGELKEVHLEQLEDYLQQKHQILENFPELKDEANGNTPKWVGVIVGSGINAQLAEKLSNGYTTACGTPIAALTIQRYKGCNGGIYVATDVYFKNNQSNRDNSKYIFNGTR